jgi:hypothetical protein
LTKHQLIVADEEFDELCFQFGIELDEVVRSLVRVTFSLLNLSGFRLLKEGKKKKKRVETPRLLDYRKKSFTKLKFLLIVMICCAWKA